MSMTRPYGLLAVAASAALTAFVTTTAVYAHPCPGGGEAQGQGSAGCPGKGRHMGHGKGMGHGEGPGMMGKGMGRRGPCRQGGAAATGDSGAGGPPTAELQAGREVFRHHCGSCHASGFAGAPVLGERVMWEGRASQGIDTLVANAISGVRAMPPRGGHPHLDNQQVRQAVEFMLWRAGLAADAGHAGH